MVQPCKLQFKDMERGSCGIEAEGSRGGQLGSKSRFKVEKGKENLSVSSDTVKVMRTDEKKTIQFQVSSYPCTVSHTKASAVFAPNIFQCHK